VFAEDEGKWGISMQYVKMARETHVDQDTQREFAQVQRSTKHEGGVRVRRGGVVRGVCDAERKRVPPCGREGQTSCSALSLHTGRWKEALRGRCRRRGGRTLRRGRGRCAERCGTAMCLRRRTASAGGACRCVRRGRKGCGSDCFCECGTSPPGVSSSPKPESRCRRW
jgi:hypothetical protein